MTQSVAAFPTLRGHRYMNLTTFRKNGRAVKTPVWFAEDNGCVYVLTAEYTGKVKRIRHTPRVQVAPANFLGSPLGPEITATARILPPTEEVRAKVALNYKYGLIKWLSDFYDALIGRTIVYLEITPD